MIVFKRKKNFFYVSLVPLNESINCIMIVIAFSCSVKLSLFMANCVLTCTFDMLNSALKKETFVH